MKLSICIPVYNFDVRNLVRDLLKQVHNTSVNAEIILIDDASTKEFCDKTKELTSEVDQLIFLSQNIGRSKIRNLFLNYSSGDYLLFLDCDGKIVRENFLQIYIDAIHNVNPAVIYGGRVVAKDRPSKNYMLRWNFAQQRENLNLKQRLFIPYRSFQTNNFVIERSVFETFQFNENLNQYGYEDLLFAMDLKEKNIPIFHVDNPIFNDDVEPNAIFLMKAKESAESLSIILKTPNINAKVSDLKLAKAFTFLEKYYLILPYRMFFKVAEKYVQKKLLSGEAHLRFLDFYKLGKLVQNMR